jgi:hypothetical protein
VKAAFLINNLPGEFKTKWLAEDFRKKLSETACGM